MRLADSIPVLCVGCRRAGAVLCAGCREFLLRSRVPRTGTCLDDDLVALGPYEGPLRSAVQVLKYREATSVATLLGRMLAEECRRELDSTSAGSVVAIPTARSRRRRRGYDQAELIAQAVASHLGIPCVRVLARRCDVPPQTVLDAELRRSLPKDVFHLDRLPDSHVVLVDDVVTTGTTMATARRALETAGTRVTCACVAVTPRRAGGRPPMVP